MQRADAQQQAAPPVGLPLYATAALPEAWILNLQEEDEGQAAGADVSTFPITRPLCRLVATWPLTHRGVNSPPRAQRRLATTMTQSLRTGVP